MTIYIGHIMDIRDKAALISGAPETYYNCVISRESIKFTVTVLDCLLSPKSVPI